MDIKKDPAAQAQDELAELYAKDKLNTPIKAVSVRCCCSLICTNVLIKGKMETFACLFESKRSREAAH